MMLPKINKNVTSSLRNPVDAAAQNVIQRAKSDAKVATKQAPAAKLVDGAIAQPTIKPAELLNKPLTEAFKSLDSQDKMGNFEIQDLMNNYNQSEKAARSVQKKKDDTDSSIINKA